MKVYCGPIIGRGRIEPDWLRSLLRLLRHPIRFEPAYNDALLCRARSQVATRFLESDCDVLLTIERTLHQDRSLPGSTLRRAMLMLAGMIDWTDDVLDRIATAGDTRRRRR